MLVKKHSEVSSFRYCSLNLVLTPSLSGSAPLRFSTCSHCHIKAFAVKISSGEYDEAQGIQHLIMSESQGESKETPRSKKKKNCTSKRLSKSLP